MAEVGGGIGVGDRAADRPAVPDLRVADVPGGAGQQAAALGQDRVERQIGVPAERADRDPVAVLAHVAKVVEAADVDEQRRPRETELEQREQGVAAGQDLRVLAPEQLDRLVDRAGAGVVEGGGDHAPALAAACTALRMLW